MNGEIINNMDYSKLEKIDTFIFDVDGVFTDGSILITEDGEFLRKMSVKDGQAVKIALQKEYNIYVITKGASSGVRKRLEILGISEIYDKVEDKMKVLNNLRQSGKVDLQKALYMGDDLPDIPVLKEVLLPCCPADAIPEVIHVSEFISSKNGGEGCVREILEKVLKAQDNWSF